MNAQSISRFLAKSGHRPLPSGTPSWREGIRVKNSLTCIARITVDLDSARQAKERTDEIQALLEDAGHTVERAHDYALRVTA